MITKQIACTKFERKLEDEQEISLICSNGVPLGVLHDYLMEMKGWCVDRMKKAHQDDQKEKEDHIKEDDSSCSSSSCE